MAGQQGTKAAKAAAATVKGTGLKRRDLLEGSRLLVKYNLAKPGEQVDQTALMLAVTYLAEKRDAVAKGESFVDFEAWLDEEITDEDDADPTE